MAEYVSITPLGASEAPVCPTPSLAVAAALALVTALERLIAAERDLGGYSGADPAVGPWFREADAAFTAVLRWVDELQAAPRRGPGDGRLRLVGQVVAGVMRCEDAGDLAQRMGLVGERRGILHMPGDNPSAGWVNGLIDAVLDRVQACVVLAEGPAWQAEAAEHDAEPDGSRRDPDAGPAALF